MKKTVLVYIISAFIFLGCANEGKNININSKIINNKKIEEVKITKNTKKNFKKNTKKINFGKGIWTWKISNSQRINSKMSWQELYNNYNQQDIFINFLKNEGFTKVYLFVGSIEWENEEYFSKNKLYNEAGLYELLKKLNSEKISTYALFYINDDPNSFKNYENIKNLIYTIENWNKKFPDAKFVGIQNDQEVNNPEKYGEYIKMLDFTNSFLKKSNLINGVAIRPSWTEEEFAGKKMINIISYYCDEMFLMDYYDKIELVIKKGQEALLSGKNINIGIETGFENVANQNTFNEEIKSNGNEWFKKFILDNINENFKINSNYKGVSIHDYNQYFQLINNKEPYLGGLN